MKDGCDCNNTFLAACIYRAIVLFASTHIYSTLSLTCSLSLPVFVHDLARMAHAMRLTEAILPPALNERSASFFQTVCIEAILYI